MPQRFQRGRTAAAVTGAAAGGVIVAALPTDLELADIDPAGLTAAVSAAVAVAAVKRWLQQKAHVRTLTEQHAIRSRALDRRERALRAREEAATRHEADHALHVRDLVARLESTEAALAAKTAEHTALQAAHEVTCSDYNALIEHVLRDGYTRFAGGRCEVFTPGTPHPADERRHVAQPVTHLRPREHQGSV
jgi:hypothetical protein